MCINLLLASIKGAAGIIGSSSALIADAIHSATDVIASAAACFGLWVADKEHPSFPYWKAETKRGFLVGKWMLTFKPDQVFVALEKEGTASALLKEAGVEVILVEESNVDKKAKR